MIRLERERMNRFWHLHVEVLPEDQVQAVAHYVDPWYEVRAWLVVEPIVYRVQRAVVEVLRTPDGKAGTGRVTLDELEGLIAYAGMGRKVVTATQYDESRLHGGLLLECAKALRQARLFLWERYGIDPAEHFEVIQRILRDSCIYFTTPEALQSVLRPKQLEQMVKWDVLFSRHRYCLMERQGEREEVKVGLSDSYHEMALTLAVEEDAVCDLDVAMLRAPHEECFLAPRRSVNRLHGVTVGAGPGEWQRRVGGADGCAHVADLAREAAASLTYWRWICGEEISVLVPGGR